MKASHTIRPVFDDPNLVSAAGLVPAMLLAESAGLHDLLAEHVSVTSPNAAVKAASVVGGMLAGADSIDDLDLLRHGGMGRLFAGVRTPRASSRTSGYIIFPAGSPATDTLPRGAGPRSPAPVAGSVSSLRAARRSPSPWCRA